MFRDVFFWALLATLAIVLEFLVFIPKKRYKRWVYVLGGITALSSFEGIRLFIPFLAPAAKPFPNWLRFIGFGLFVLGVIVMIGAFVQIMKAKKEGWRLRTSGFYGIVRHPLYFGDVLWNFGWCVAFSSPVGIWLTLVWIFLRYTLAVLEEEKLVEKYGETYLNYTRLVRARIIPFLL